MRDAWACSINPMLGDGTQKGEPFDLLPATAPCNYG